MTLDKWHDILDRVKEAFEIDDEGKYSIDEQGGVELEYVDFYAPMGLVRLELSCRPRVIGRKTSYSNRIGSEVDIEYTYDYNDLIYQLDAYLYNEQSDEWVPLEDPNIFS